MAVAKVARVTSSAAAGPLTRLIDFELSDPLGFTGGQYIIVNSGLPLPGGKMAKRAFSILSGDAEQTRFTVAVRKIGAGPGSNYMHGLTPGAEVPFSGPWGQYLPPSEEQPGRTLILATDTGITAALGLLRGRRFSSQLSRCALIWMVVSNEDFLPVAFVRDLLPQGLASVRIECALAVDHPDRAAKAIEWVQSAIAQQRPDSVYLSGDGAVLAPVRERFIAGGVPESAVRMETFFNHLTKKSSG